MQFFNFKASSHEENNRLHGEHYPITNGDAEAN